MVQKRKSNKNATFPSHEFFIQNHGDIAVTLMCFFMIGLVFQPANKMCSKILFMNYNISKENITVLETRDHNFGYYVSGPMDWCNIIYYSIGWIVLHALFQEYILDKVVKKSLSKSKLCRFNESAHLSVFYMLSIALIGYIFKLEQYPASLSFLWMDYPHVYHLIFEKMFFIGQISYWIHVFPEFYLQRVRREHIPVQITYASLYLVFITAGYFMNLCRLTLFLLAIHFACEALFHVARLLKITDREKPASICFAVWGCSFVLARLATIATSFLVLWVGLGRSTLPHIDIKNGNFNTSAIRFACASGVCCLQLWLMWHFLHFQLKFRKDMALGKAAARFVGSDGEETDSQEEPAQDSPHNTPRKKREKIPP